MPDPITLGSILGWSAITAIGGIIGNRADAKFCQSLEETLRLAEAHKPGSNHDIQKAIHEACYDSIIQLANASPAEQSLRLIEAFANQRMVAGPDGATAHADLSRGIHKLAEGDSPLAGILDQIQAEIAAAVHPHQLSPEFLAKFRTSWVPWTARNYDERIKRDGVVRAISLFEIGTSTKRLVERAVELGEENLQVSKEALALLQGQRGEAKLRQPTPLVDVPDSGRGIFGRDVEIAAILAELRRPGGRPVIPVVAPPGFGKSALLEGVIRKAAPIPEAGGERIITEPGLRGVVWVDCRTNNFDGYLLEQCGRLAGEVERFQKLDSALDLLRELKGLGTVWIVFDFFERLLDGTHRIESGRVRELFEERLRGSYACRFLLGTRQLPELGPMLAVEPIDAVEKGLQVGLPLDAAVAQLKEIGGGTALARVSDDALGQVAERLWRIPQALVSAVGWLLTKPQMGMRNLLGQQFAAEDREAGMFHLMRLHVEAQRPQDVRMLQLVAVFDFPVPEQALGSLGSETQREASLGRLLRNLVLQFSRDVFGHVRYQVSHALLGEAARDARALDEARRVTWLGAATHCKAETLVALNGREWRLALDLAECRSKLCRQLGSAANSKDLAAAVMSKGSALERLGRGEDALAAHEEAIGIWRELVEGGRKELANDLAAAVTNKGLALRNLGRNEEELAGYEEAIGIWRELVEGGRRELASDLASAVINKGSALDILGRGEEALTTHEEAIGIWRELVDGGRKEMSNKLATAVMNKGLALSNLGRSEEGLKAYEEAVGVWRELVDGGRKELADDLARAVMHKGNALDILGRSEEALEAYEEAIDIQLGLVKGGREELADDLAGAVMNTGIVLRRLGRSEEALAAYEEAIGIWRGLVEGGQKELTKNLAMAVMNKGVALGSSEQGEEELAAYEEAIGIWRELVDGGRKELVHNLGQAVFNRAIALRDAGRKGEALEDAREARDLLKALVGVGRRELLAKLEDAERVVKGLE